MNSTTKNSELPTAAVLTAGCRLNQAESDALRHQLVQQGVRLVEPGTPVTTSYVNTCAVTAAAERSSIALLRQARRHSAQVVALGCLAELAPARLRAAGADVVWTTQQKRALLDGLLPRPARSRALLKVQDGCTRRCAYCIVSSLRGQQWSLPVAQAVAIFRKLADQGYHEIVLTGLNLGRYADSGLGLAGLVRALLAATPVPRIRLGSLEPDTIDAELISLIAEPRLCPHLHLPLQSGDDAILRRMHRAYTTADYQELVRRLRKVRPDINIGADVIVGFPGEDDASFARTVEFLDRSGISYLHVFRFSPRPGLAVRGEPPPAAAVRKRVHLLREWSATRRRQYELSFVGTVRPAIIEPQRKALTDNYLRIQVAASLVPGQLVPLTLGSSNGRIWGRPV